MTEISKELFDQLEENYPDVIEQMRDEFTSHEFIEKLSQSHQGIYVQVLSEYEQNGQPFQTVHSIIARRLKKNWSHLVEHIDTDNKSENIFGNDSSAAVWRRLR